MGAIMLKAMTLISLAIFIQANAQTDDLDKKLAEIVPSGQSEAYRNIPWQTDLVAARDLAKKTGKPLFLWVMDGHPLGCT